MNPTLFGHLASRFSSSPENLATEALAFLLARSSDARSAVLSLPAAAGLVVGPDLAFRTQVSDSADQSIPDLVGFDERGRPAMIVEAKFWAGLTVNQPNAYWARLSDSEPSVLMFLAPTRRLPTLWPELLRLLGGNLVPDERGQPGALTVRDPQGRLLMLVGWRVILLTIQARLEGAGELRLLEDLHQLQGLCERMDEEAFLPLGAEELTDLRLARRYLQFTRIVDDVVNDGVHEGLLSIQGLKMTHGRGFHGRYVRLMGFGAMLQCDMRKWTQLQETPFWLTVLGTDFRPSPSVQSGLQALAIESPPRMFPGAGRTGGEAIPLRASTGVERPLVVAALLDQIRGIGRLLAAIAPDPPIISAELSEPEAADEI